MSNLIIEAAKLAQRAHDGQKRKVSGDPYIVHPGRVASRVALFAHAQPEWLAAAWCHDVLEDCDGYTAAGLISTIGIHATLLVEELTNPSKKFPQRTRPQRKAMDREHIATISTIAQLIKCADRIDNLGEMVGMTDEFKSIYLTETKLLRGVLTDQLHRAGVLTNMLVNQIGELMNAENKLELTILKPINHTA